MEWISIKNELPEEGEPVIVCTPIGICIAHFIGFSTVSEKPEWIETNGDDPFRNVTHWMPLPNYPEE